jgi:mevalonate kinase
MLSPVLSDQCTAVERLGGAAKLSGAGASGVLLTYTADSEEQKELQSTLMAAGGTRLALNPEIEGLVMHNKILM